jgi:membrane protein YqaA with SNARE-associated domain
LLPDAAALTALGPAGLFLAALLAGSLLPFPSEVVLAALILAGQDPWLLVGVATLGNVLGAATVFAVGAGVAPRRLRAWLGRLPEEAATPDEAASPDAAASPDEAARMARAGRSLDRWGPPVLLLSWVPVIGDALVLAAGLAGAPPLRCLLFVTLGKGVRYTALAWPLVAIAQP